MKSNTQIAGILLAAGNSIRMGQPKALLTYNGVSFMDTILNNLQTSKFNPIISILGEAGERICQSTSVNHYECWYNPRPQEGMLSSLKIAIKKLPEHCEGFVLALVDHPVVRQETYRKLFRAAAENPKRIIIPRFCGRKGHPVFFGRPYFEPLLHTPNEHGARMVVRRHQDEIFFLPVEDAGILQDVDTPQEYKALAY